MSKTAFRLSMDQDLEQFRPEIEFACQFLERCHPVQRQHDADRILHYGRTAPAGALHIPSALFPAAVRIDENGIHPNPSAMQEIETGINGMHLLPPYLAGTDGQAKHGRVASLPYDALGLIFNLLSRLEERDSPAVERDRYLRFPMDASLSYRRASLDTPLADLAARDIAAALIGTSKPEISTTYNVWLTHDVDRLRGYHRRRETLRKSAGELIYQRNPKAAARRLWRELSPGEPWRSCRHIMDLSERYGHTSRFYFMGPVDNHMDSPYVIDEPDVVKRLADEMVSRGHVLGFHPGVYTHGNATEWRRQKEGIEAVLGHTLTEGRHHGMLFEAETTWDIWNDGGMQMDASLGYPERSGFRSGTCRAHATYSLRRRKTLDLLEVPSPILDFGFFGGRYRDISVDDALAECQGIIDTCREHGGDLMILYHTSQNWRPQTTFYEQLIERV
ncbi:MAG TPA: hypothetical protein EYQ81_16085 [Sneathiellales bacterium]|nr:hypothetical protein [Sneathiellales bacterium]